MTKEEKQLLLKDLCARFPYGVKGLHRGQVHELFTIDGREVNNACIQVDGYDAWFSVDTFKPYLRPMSSMTDNERGEYRKAFDKDFTILEDSLITPIAYKYADGTIVRDRILFNELDWLNENMFDYRGLIPMGLALEAPEGMYENN